MPLLLGLNTRELSIKQYHVTIERPGSNAQSHGREILEIDIIQMMLMVVAYRATITVSIID